MMPNADFLAERQKYYAGILNDLFDPTPHMNSIRIFEFVCALVRTGGLELGGFDPWYESKAIIDLATAKKYVFDRLTDGRFHPKVAKIFPFAQTVEAYKYLESNAQVGKVAISVP